MINSENSLSPLVGHDESLGSGPIRGARPEERVGPVAIVVEGGQQQSVLVDGVNIARYLVVVHVELAEVLAPVFLIFLGDYWKLKIRKIVV